MKIQSLFDIDEYIKVNDIKEVKSQRIYSFQNVFHPEGLFSEEIFGQTTEERTYRCGYIKLPIHVFNPMIAKTILSRSGGIIKKMAYAEVRCNIENKVLVAAPDGQYTGLKDLYNIWDQIDIAKTLNTRSQESLDILIKSPKRLIFNDKVLVLPPEFRKIGIKNGRPVKAELNNPYSAILGAKSVTSHTTTSTIYQIYNKFQNAVINIFTYIQTLISGKDGFLQKNLMAKTTLWTARNVISAPKYDTDHPEIGIFRTGYPMDSLCSMFNPFIRFQMKQFLSFNNIQNIHPNKNEVSAIDIENIYDNKMIDDLIRIYMKNPGSRFRIMYLDPDEKKPIIFEAFDVKNNTTISRPLTLTDVIYLCCQDAVVRPNRYVYTVRYPIGDYLGSFFTQVHILSTNKTTEIQFMGDTYNHYPVVDPTLSHRVVATLFASTVTPSNSRLPAIGGDYDGDTVKSLGIWSDEANKRAEELMYSKIYNITPQCTSVYSIGIECVNGLYALTK